MSRHITVCFITVLLVIGSTPGLAALTVPGESGATHTPQTTSSEPLPACATQNQTLSVSAGPDFETSKDETVRFVANVDPDDAEERVASYEWRDESGNRNKGKSNGKGKKGGGSSQILSTQQSFETQFKAGKHTITLTVETTDGRTLTDTVNVTVRGKGSGAERDSPPEADAGDCRMVIAGEDTELDGTESYDRDGTIESYDWDTDGDSETDATGPTPTVQFHDLGNQTVELTVTDDGGLTDTDTVNLFVNDRPAASFDYTPTRLNPDEEITFDASSSADILGGIDAYRWDFDGDGTTDAIGANVSHAFETPGDHTVALTVVDAYGVSNTTAATVHVNAPPTANASESDQQVNVGESVALDGSASTDPEDAIERYEWDVDGDGEFEKTGTTANHTFETAGDRNITLRVTDDGGLTDTDAITIAVNSPPTARIDASNETVVVGGSVAFDGTDSTDSDGEIVAYEWDFDGDGETDATGPTAEHTFENDGGATVRLTVTDDDGTTDTATKTIVVLPDEIDEQPPDIPAPPENPRSGSGTGDPHFSTFDGRNYDFQGVGEFVLAREPNGSLSVQGRLEPYDNGPVSVTEAAATSLDGHNVTIDTSDATPLVVDGTRYSLEPTDRLAVGNGTIFRRGSNYIIVYPGPDGEVDAGDERLTVEHRGSFLDIALTLRADRTQAVEGILGTPDEDAPDIALANGTAVSPSDYDELYGSFRADWLVDNRTESHFHYEEGESPDGFYDPDYPTELLTVEDLPDDERSAAEHAAREAGLEPGTAAFENAVLDYALTGNESYLESAATSQPVNASFTIEAGSSFAAGANDSVTFAATVSNESADDVTVEWRFGDGATATGTQVAHAYDATGTYTVTATATGPNGDIARDTLAVTVGENVTTSQPPIANVETTRPNETHVRLDASESIDPDGNVTGYAWDTDGDGAVEAYGETVTVALESASPEVSLVALDNDGNRASETVRVNFPPEADATASPPTVATGETVTFDASNSTDPDGDSLTYEWDFDGDGATDATGETVMHVFNATGTHNVTLTVSDGGQTDTDTVSVSAISRVLFRENFEDGNYDGWTTIKGAWEVSPGGADNGTYKLRSTASGHSRIKYSEQFPHDATYKISGMVESGPYGDLSIFFNYKDSNNYYGVAYYPDGTDNPTFSIYKIVDGTGTLLATQSPDIGTGRWIRFTIDRTAAGETTVTAHAPSTGTTDTLTVTDDSLIGSGTIGFKTWQNGQSRFDNITITGTTNEAPDAVITTNKTDITTGSTVSFDASNSSDPDGDSLTYEWDFDGDGTYDATGATVTHSYSESGTYNATLRVSDERGESATDTVSVSVDVTAPTNGLVTHWKLDGDATDSVGHFDGTVQDGTGFADGKVGQAGEFDGSDDSIGISTNDGLPTNAITVSTWVNYDQTPGKYKEYFVGTKYNRDGIGWGLASARNGELSFRISTGSYETVSVSESVSSLGLTTGTWYHVTGTWDGSTMSLYVNGTKVATRSYSGDLHYGNTLPAIAAMRNGFDRHNFDGTVDDVRIYDRALTESEISDLYNATS